MARLTELARGGGCGCKMPPGELAEILSPLLANAGRAPEDLIVGPATRDDAAAWRIDGERALISTADFFAPMVDDPELFGRIAATNAISDVYAMGGEPLLALSLLAAPTEKISRETVSGILEGGRRACEENGVTIAGGHSIVAAEPLYGLAVTGIAPAAQLRTNSAGRVGDVLILGKPLGIGILCAAVKRGTVSDAGLEALETHATKPNSVGRELAADGLVNAMTDVTGFGLLGHLAEICAASSCSAEVREAEVPLIPESVALAQGGEATGAGGRNWRDTEGKVTGWQGLSEWRLGLLTDPQTSGGLLVSCAPSSSDRVLALFRERGYAQAAVIGSLAAGAPAIRIRQA